MTATELLQRLGIQDPTKTQRTIVIAALAPGRRAEQTVASEQARVAVLRDAIEDLLSSPQSARAMRRRLQRVFDATTYDGRSALAILESAR